MFVVCNRVVINPEHVDAFEERFLSRAGLVDTMPGFVSFQLLRPVKADDGYMVMVTWETKADFQAWMKSQEFKDGHARTGSLPQGTFMGAQSIEHYELIGYSARSTEAKVQ
ncbi:MAG TPA: antibiotic biosynthesis monooxygenase [Phototrophicaceae bacterium]|jgi:heme-degrading monooxygenase HmoA|nr:antibiotic biosynthesis monooxygenase [Phototrophicaceae bacterium]